MVNGSLEGAVDSDGGRALSADPLDDPADATTEAPTDTPAPRSDRLTDEQVIATWQDVIDGFTRAHRRIVAPVESGGLPEPHFAALMLLVRAQDQRLPMSRLAQELGMTSGGFTKLADRLARDGMIDRRNSAGDRRVVYAALTTLGEQTVRDAERTYASSVRAQVLAVIGGDALIRAADTMKSLREANQAVVPEGVDSPPFVAQDRDPSLPDRRRTPRD